MRDWVEAKLYWPPKSSESGQDLSEYGLLVAFIALIVFAGAVLFGQSLLSYFNNMAGTIANW